MLDMESIRTQFPVLSTEVNGRPLVYLDNAATTQMPLPVLATIDEHYRCFNANIHRGIHYLSEKSTQHYERARALVKDFIGAQDEAEIVFTSGTTDSINKAAYMFAAARLRAGDEVVVTELEHHSNYVPWQMVCKQAGAAFRVAPMADGQIDLEALEAMLNDKTRMVAVTQVSNLTGAIADIKRIVDAAHQVGAAVLVDGAQAVRHGAIKVKELGCDFYCFSGHKMMGPSGIGVLYLDKSWHEVLSPAWFGGGMVNEVGALSTTFGPAPHCFEAGTPNVSGAIALGSAIEFMNGIGCNAIAEREFELTRYLERALRAADKVQVLGNPERRVGAVSFTAAAHPYDLASILDKMGVAVRSGHLCAQPALERFGCDAVVRVSPAFYNTEQEIDLLMEAIERSLALLGKS